MTPCSTNAFSIFRKVSASISCDRSTPRISAPSAAPVGLTSMCCMSLLRESVDSDVRGFHDLRPPAGVLFDVGAELRSRARNDVEAVGHELLRQLRSFERAHK